MENINYVAHLKGLSADNMRHILGFPFQKPAPLLIQSVSCFLVMRQYLAESLETVTVEEGHEQAGSGFWRIAARPPRALFPMRLSGIWPWCSFCFGNKCISGVLESVTGMQRMKPGYCSYPCFISRRKVNEASKSGHKLLTQLCKMGRKQQLGEP